MKPVFRYCRLVAIICFCPTKNDKVEEPAKAEIAIEQVDEENKEVEIIIEDVETNNVPNIMEIEEQKVKDNTDRVEISPSKAVNNIEIELPTIAP